MASVPCRYVNKNPFPIYLPTDRGGQVLFRPNEGATQEWFSRFVGPGQLTREVINPNPPAVQAVQAAVRQLPRAPGQTFADFEANEFTYLKGIYRCKLCDMFRTGSRDSLKNHFEDYHGVPNVMIPLPRPHHNVVLTPPAPKPEDEEQVVVVSSKPTAVQPVQQQAPVVQTTKPVLEPIQQGEAVKESSTFACPHPGCGKEFATQTGLKKHITVKHKAPSA